MRYMLLVRSATSFTANHQRRSVDLAMDRSGYMCCQQRIRIVCAIICFRNFAGLKNYCKLKILNNGYEKAALYAVVIFTIFYC